MKKNNDAFSSLQENCQASAFGSFLFLWLKKSALENLSPHRFDSFTNRIGIVYCMMVECFMSK
ncbi:hypothetical protein ACN6MS_00440 [Bacillus licheniformis]